MKTEAKKTAKKELEASITDKFMAALSDLGHDVTKLKREVKKASKFVSKKIERKFKDVKTVIGEKLESEPVNKAVKKVGKSTTIVKNDVIKIPAKVEKVIAKATKIAEKKIKKPVEDFTEKIDSAITDTKAAVAKPSKKAAAKVPETGVVPNETPVSKTARAGKPKKVAADADATVN